MPQTNTDTITTPAWCSNGHQPGDYQEFIEHCSNVRDWPNWPDGEMHVGECRSCRSTVSYPPPPSCFVVKTGIDVGRVMEMTEVATRLGAEQHAKREKELASLETALTTASRRLNELTRRYDSDENRDAILVEESRLRILTTLHEAKRAVN